MDTSDNTVSAIRQFRQKRILNMNLLLSSPHINQPELNSLDWSSLCDVPDWCHWQPFQIKKLTLIAGALFAAPAIRLWIETDRVEAARTIIGVELFNQIMSDEPAINVKLDFPDDMNLKELFYSTGATVLLYSMPYQSLRERLAFLLPQPSGSVSEAVAQTLYVKALNFIKINEPAEKVS